jgi:hypothetical protein
MMNVDRGIRCSSIGRKDRLPSTQMSADLSPAVVKSPRQKRGAQPLGTKATNLPAVTESKPGRGRNAGPQPRAATPLPAAETAADAMGDLIALEAENKCLRQALSEKLRAENADLRKKLGQA